MKKSTMTKLVICFVLGGAFAATAPALAVDNAPAAATMVANPPSIHTQADITTAAGMQP